MKKLKGAYTLEATIVMSTIILLLFTIYYAFMIMYQNALVSYAASYAASEGAKYWVTNNDGLYYHIKELNQNNAKVIEKKNYVKNLATNNLKKGIVPVKNMSVDVEFENSWGQRNIIVTVTQKISVPFSLIAKYFNNGNDFEIKAKSKANLAEPMEMIRNVDFVKDWVTQISKWIGKAVGGKLEGNKNVKNFNDNDIVKIIKKLF